jgi:hypothetical protein
MISWDIFSLGKELTSNTGRSTSLVRFSNYTTNMINNTKQKTAVLIEKTNGTQAGTCFWFNEFSIYAGLSLENNDTVNRTFMSDLLLCVPLENSYGIGGLHKYHEVNVTHNISFIADQCVNLIISRIDVNWCSNINFFMGGMVEKFQNHDLVVLAFGNIRLIPKETFSMGSVLQCVPLKAPQAG